MLSPPGPTIEAWNWFCPLASAMPDRTSWAVPPMPVSVTMAGWAFGSVTHRRHV